MPSYVIQIFREDDPSEDALTLRVEADSPEEALEQAQSTDVAEESDEALVIEGEAVEEEDEPNEYADNTRV